MADNQNGGLTPPENGKKKLKSGRASSGGLQGLYKNLKNIQVPAWIPVVLVAVVAVALAAMFFIPRDSLTGAQENQGTVFADQYDPDALIVEVLPQTVRSFDAGEAANPFVPFTSAETLDSLTLTGIIINSNGKGTAIVEAGGVSFVVSLGDKLPESDWEVSRVEKNSVTFALEDTYKTIYMKN